MNRNRLLQISLSVLFSFYLLSCSYGNPFSGNEDMEYATKIIRIDVEPNPVIAGENATFTCIIEDSLDESLIFKWSLPTGENDRETASTTVNRYTTGNITGPGSYVGSIHINKSNKSALWVRDIFEYEVIEKPE